LPSALLHDNNYGNNVFRWFLFLTHSEAHIHSFIGIRTAKKSNDQDPRRQGCPRHRLARHRRCAAHALTDQAANVAITYVASADKAEAAPERRL
jgi:hypothetical protein